MKDLGPKAARRPNAVRRAALAISLLAFLLLPLAFLGTLRAIRENENDLSDWLPAAYEETQQYRIFQQFFGSEDFVVVSWPGCELDAPQLSDFANELTRVNEQTAAEGSPVLIRRITTGTEIMDQLSVPPASLDTEEAVERLRGILIGPDERQTCALVTLSPAGRKSLRKSLDTILDATAQVGLSPDDVHLGGPPVINAAIDRASAESLARLSGLAAVIGVAVAIASFRSVRLTFIVFAVSVFSTLVALSLVPVSGMKLNAVVVTMVPLVYVAAMSGAIHFVNYYLEEQRCGAENPLWQAVCKAILPLVLAAITTSVGLLSLLYSDLAPIRQFGAFSAAGVMVAFVVQLTVLPALLELLGGAAPHAQSEPASHEAARDSVWTRIAEWGMQRQRMIQVGVLILFIVASVGLSQITTSIQIMRLFGSGNRVLVSYAWLEQHLGGLVPMEVVLQFPRRSHTSTRERLNLVEALGSSVRELPEVSGCLSAATFTPRVPKNAMWIQRFATERLIARSRPKLLATGLVADAGEGEAWRISVRMDSAGDPDYGFLFERLKQHVESFVTERDPLAEGNPQVMVTGAVPILFKARRSLLNGMTLGLVMDVVLVCVAVAVLLRSLSHGLLLAVISLLPVMIVFGGMGLTGIVVDIGSVMAPCVALGVTVDDVIHWLLWYHRGQRQGLASSESIKLAHAHCAQAMFQSWGVIGLGLTVFTLSPFVPTYRFGVLMVLLLTVNLLANLFLLPALVLSRRVVRGAVDCPAPAK